MFRPVVGVGAHERESIGALDHVHVEALDQVTGEGVTIGDVDRDMVETRQLQGVGHVTRSVG